MDAYNLVNGVYMTANNHLNNEIVKQEWGFDGIIMSDWTAPMMASRPPTAAWTWKCRLPFI